MFKSAGSFIEPESNVSLHPKKKESYRKESTTIKKYGHKKNSTKILSYQEATDEIEIDSQ